MASHDSPPDYTESRRPRTRGSNSHRLFESVPLEQRVLASSIPRNRAAHANRLAGAQACGPGYMAMTRGPIAVPAMGFGCKPPSRPWIADRKDGVWVKGGYRSV